LIVTDSLIENPLTWKLADIKFQFGDDSASTAANLQQQEKASLYSKRPEIKHLFRPAEPTPPAIVSTVFAGLCAAPLVLLIILVI
jgi:oligosaccharyltransferase complex subunit delta (ribophorin II)